MRTWRLARFDQHCRGCNGNIAKGEKYLEVESAAVKTTRCRTCAVERWGETEPDVVEEDLDAAPLTPPAGVRYQPSLGLTPIADDFGFNLRRRR